jgi:hypothetical protein
MVDVVAGGSGVTGRVRMEQRIRPSDRCRAVAALPDERARPHWSRCSLWRNGSDAAGVPAGS